MTTGSPWLKNLQRDLDELEASDPRIAECARRLEEVGRRIVTGRTPHAMPCTDLSCAWHHDVPTA